MTKIKIGDYLFQRLRQLGIQSIFGVPGDYELALLDLVEDNDLVWKGNPNELVASYASDGYARVHGAAAFITTFGPGELSAYCGMAGHYCEYVPVVHIVGYPGVPAVKGKAIMHHSLGDGRFDMYHKMAEHITAATAVIDNETTATAEIDRVLNTMLKESKPGYIGLSVDMAYELIDDAGLHFPLVTTLAPNDAGLEAKAVAEIRALMEKAKQPTIVVDGGAVRHDALVESTELSNLVKFPTFSTCMGKGAIDETLPHYAGIYGGAGTHPEILPHIEGSDLILWIGSYLSDFNTGEFTMQYNKAAMVDFQRFFVKIGDDQVDLKMKYLLQALIKSLKDQPLERTSTPKVTWSPFTSTDLTATGKLTQDFLWPAFAKFIKTGDLIITETGTSAYGIAETPMPPGVLQFNQTVYGSIGYATGAIVGACQAIKENGKFKRGVLITGEGSMHLTVQALSDLLRWDLRPIIFVLNNGGYTVERLIHGPNAAYNKVAIWDYSKLAEAMGPQFKSKYHGPIESCEQLIKLFEDPGFATGECFELVELVLEPLDAPVNVRLCGKAIDEFNKKKVAK